MSGCDGILVPGVFDRRFEGKISAIQYAERITFLFWDLFRVTNGNREYTEVFAESKMQIQESNKKTKNYLIDIMKNQKNIKEKGGTMRLGKYPCNLKKSSKAYNAYKKIKISERHNIDMK